MKFLVRCHTSHGRLVGPRDKLRAHDARFTVLGELDEKGKLVERKREGVPQALEGELNLHHLSTGFGLEEEFVLELTPREKA